MKILLIGDSIRMFYQREVASQLGDDYEIFAPKENCRYSLYVLNSLRFWLNSYPTPDIIHFNAGLWDTAILYREDGCFIDLEIYVKYMKSVLRELKKTGAKIIFATTTPVSDEKEILSGPNPPAHKNQDIINYNNAVLEAFKDEDIIVNDLFSVVYPQKEKYLSEDMIHPNADGVKLLGATVANCIKKCGVYENKKCAVNSPKNINKEAKTIQ
jgi:hypothetical protein